MAMNPLQSSSPLTRSELVDIGKQAGLPPAKLLSLLSLANVPTQEAQLQGLMDVAGADKAEAVIMAIAVVLDQRGALPPDAQQAAAPQQPTVQTSAAKPVETPPASQADLQQVSASIVKETRAGLPPNKDELAKLLKPFSPEEREQVGKSAVMALQADASTMMNSGDARSLGNAAKALGRAFLDVRDMGMFQSHHSFWMDAGLPFFRRANVLEGKPADSGGLSNT